MKMLYTIPPVVVVIIWGISHFYDFAFTYKIFHRQIWIYSESGDFGFEYDGKTRTAQFFESGRDYGSKVIKNRSSLESLRGSGFLFAKWYRMRMIRVPYWGLFGIALMGTVCLYVADWVGTRVSPATPKTVLDDLEAEQQPVREMVKEVVSSEPPSLL